MLCFQCEQTAKPNGCSKVGVCTKDPRTAALQDLIVYGCGFRPAVTPKRFVQLMFITLTNVNHSIEALESCARELLALCSPEYKEHYNRIVEKHVYNAILSPLRLEHIYGKDLNAIAQLGIQGVKGASAYADHTYRLVEALGVRDQELDDLCSKLEDLTHYFACEATMETGLSKLLEIGSTNFKITELLDQYNAQFNGTPELTKVPTTLRPGKCILVTGHDLVDLRTLLDEAEKQGVDVYTHGEMLPSFMYPNLKKSPRLVGNFGHAWQHQQREFELFPGPILFTTNCIMKPRDSYINQCFATGVVGYERVKHIKNDDWALMLRMAKEMKGFESEQQCRQVEAQLKNDVQGVVGFNHRVFDQLMPTLLEMIKSKKIAGFRFIGGCDGINAKRNVFTKLAETCPRDRIVLTAACGRFKVNQSDLGDIDGIPRLLDMGQCNDVYSAVIILVKLASALGCDVNSLPVELFVSWYEQKAIVQFLTLLSLGVKNIHLGPTLPVCITPAVLQILIDTYAVSLISE